MKPGSCAGFVIGDGGCGAWPGWLLACDVTIWRTGGVSGCYGSEAPVGRGNLPRPRVPGSLVAASVCHAVLEGGRRRRPCPGGFRAGRGTAVHVVPASCRAAGRPGGRYRGGGGAVGVLPGPAGAVPGVRGGVLAGAWRVRPGGGRWRGRRPPGADRLGGAPVPLPGSGLREGHVRRAG